MRDCKGGYCGKAGRPEISKPGRTLKVVEVGKFFLHGALRKQGKANFNYRSSAMDVERNVSMDLSPRSSPSQINTCLKVKRLPPKKGSPISTSWRQLSGSYSREKALPFVNGS